LASGFGTPMGGLSYIEGGGGSNLRIFAIICGD